MITLISHNTYWFQGAPIADTSHGRADFEIDAWSQLPALLC